MCLEVFFGRMLDVAIGSVRTIFLVKGKNLLACLFSFVEILIWFYIAREILTSREVNTLVVFCYAGGYSFGTYVGGLISKYFVKGNMTAFVVSSSNEDMIEKIKHSGYGVSILSKDEDKIILMIEFQKRDMKNLKTLISKLDKSAFLVVNESIHVENGYMP